MLLATSAWASSWTSTQAKKATAKVADSSTAASPATAGAHSSRLRTTTTANPANHDRSSRTGTPATRPSPTPSHRAPLVPRPPAPRPGAAPEAGHSSSRPRPLAQEVA